MTKTNTVPPVLPFLMKANITFIIRNAAGNEEKKVVSATFQLDEKAVTMPWYVLRNFFAPAYLNKTVGPQGSAWIKIYEARIEKIINRQNPNNIDQIPLRCMTMDQLEHYVARWEMPLNPRDFHSVEYARQMVDLFEKDPIGYKKQYEAYVQGLTRKYPELDGVRRAMNDSVVNPDLDREFDALTTTSTPTLPNPSTSSPDQVLDAALVEEPVKEPAKTPKLPKSKKSVVTKEQVVEEHAAPAKDPFEGV